MKIQNRKTPITTDDWNTILTNNILQVLKNADEPLTTYEIRMRVDPRLSIYRFTALLNNLWVKQKIVQILLYKAEKMWYYNSDERK